MVIASFNSATGWAGKKITFENEQFILEGHGSLSARDVMEYDKQGHIVWANEGTRAWVGSRAQAPTPLQFAPTGTGTAVSVRLEDARRHYANGDNKRALRALQSVVPGCWLDPADAQGVLELASAIRATDDRQLHARCERLISIAETPAPAPRPGAGAGGAAGDQRTSGQMAASLLGLLLLIGGLIVAFYFLAVFDVSVEVPYEDLGYGITVGGDRVNNIGLMADRNNGIIIGFALAIGGGILMVVGRKRTRPQVASPAAGPGSVSGATVKGACNACGGLMDVGVAYCPHCGQKLSWTGVEVPPTAT